MEEKEINETIRGYMKTIAKDVKERYKKCDYTLYEYMDRIVRSVERILANRKINYATTIRFFHTHYNTNNVWFGVRCFAYDIYENDLCDSL